MLLLIAVQIIGIVLFGLFSLLAPHYQVMCHSVMAIYLICAVATSLLWLARDALGSHRGA